MDDVQEDIASLGVRNWKTMASDRVLWSTVVKEAKVHFGLQSQEEEEYTKLGYLTFFLKLST